MLAGRAVDVVLKRQGYTGPDLDLARDSVRYWFRARKSTHGRRGSVVGLGVVVARAGLRQAAATCSSARGERQQV